MDYYSEIKNELVNNEINRKVKNYSINKSDLITYYNVGKVLFNAGKHYGEGIIKEYSKMLTNELGKGYTQSRLRYFRRFYEVFSKCPTLSDKLSYSHYCELIWNDDFNKINYYINISISQNLLVTPLKKEHIGQIEIYMNYIDKNLKEINQNKTIGIIICKRENKYVIEYSSDKRIIAREYELL